MNSLSSIFNPFTGDNLTEWFRDLTELWHETGPIAPEDPFTPKGMSQWIHYQNYLLWHLEDDARRTDLADAEIVRCKRSIDKHNQLRNDGIEQIDSWIDNVLVASGIKPGDEVERNSETPGSIIDRLSILSLKVFHMNEQSRRKDLDKESIELCRLRHEILVEQRDDLATALDRLFLDLRQARKHHKPYRQFKLYNDPRFNPAVYKHRSQL